MKIVYIKQTQFIKTTDWWCGNYLAEGKLSDDYDIDECDISTWNGREYVEVKLIICTASWNKLARVAVWGNDDFAMVRDFELEDCYKAIALYEELINKEVITQNELRQKQFEIF